MTRINEPHIEQMATHQLREAFSVCLFGFVSAARKFVLENLHFLFEEHMRQINLFAVNFQMHIAEWRGLGQSAGVKLWVTIDEPGEMFESIWHTRDALSTEPQAISYSNSANTHWISDSIFSNRLVNILSVLYGKGHIDPHQKRKLLYDSILGVPLNVSHSTLKQRQQNKKCPIWKYKKKTQKSASFDQQHRNRFKSTCPSNMEGDPSMNPYTYYTIKLVRHNCPSDITANLMKINNTVCASVCVPRS